MLMLRLPAGLRSLRKQLGIAPVRVCIASNFTVWLVNMICLPLSPIGPQVRFSPPIEGVWTWTTASTSIPALRKHAGKVTVLSARSVAKGCPSSQGKKLGFAFPDGSTYNPIGTTCYAWVHQPEGDALEEQTLSSLKSSPFNKVRTRTAVDLCVWKSKSQSTSVNLVLLSDQDHDVL